jgi:pyruvate dehydrogenase E2 component (dihydrolipoamide acetyltransferase)
MTHPPSDQASQLDDSGAARSGEAGCSAGSKPEGERMPGVSEAITVEVPDIGDFEGVPVIEILVAPGDSVAVDDPLVTLESDKATMDVPAPFAGVVQELRVKIGDEVSQGTELLTIAPAEDGPGASGSKSAAIASEGAPTEAAAPDSVGAAARAEAAESVSPVAAAGDGAAHAAPAATDSGGPVGPALSAVTGSGRKGRITKGDVEGFVGRGPGAAGVPGRAAGLPGPAVAGLDLAPWPVVDFEKFGPVERVERTRIQKISAPNLARNWVMIPHVTHNDEADITELEAFRKQLNSEQDVKVTMVAFLVVACVATLKEFPHFNSSLDGDELVLKHYYNIGFAADTPGGLVVPVIKNADGKGLFEVAEELTELSGKARAGKLMPGDMQGSTFTISSLGGIGGTSFTPIVNAPEVAILGVTRSSIKPVWNGSSFEPRLMVPLSLSYDHRVIDGAAAARFMAFLGRVLSDLRRALL